ncbi:MAG: hypothetical protein LBG06_05700 [Deltaproteobacteria bacterium]|nr:hypothetical protein [Deltaproteobacteria bacterium]
MSQIHGFPAPKPPHALLVQVIDGDGGGLPRLPESRSELESSIRHERQAKIPQSVPFPRGISTFPSVSRDLKRWYSPFMMTRRLAGEGFQPQSGKVNYLRYLTFFEDGGSGPHVAFQASGKRPVCPIGAERCVMYGVCIRLIPKLAFLRPFRLRPAALEMAEIHAYPEPYPEQWVVPPVQGGAMITDDYSDAAQVMKPPVTSRCAKLALGVLASSFDPLRISRRLFQTCELSVRSYTVVSTMQAV